MAEGGGLLNRCTVKSCTGGSNPPLSATQSKLQRECAESARITRRIAAIQRVLGLIRTRENASPISLSPTI